METGKNIKPVLPTGRRLKTDTKILIRNINTRKKIIK